MEIGSYIEMQFPKGKEYYKGNKNIARLNSGRSGIFHAARLSGVKKVYLPYYQCDTVREFLKGKKIETGFYHVDSNFNIIDDGSMQEEAASGNAAVVIVNYYGIMSSQRMRELIRPYKHVIIDNCQAFFSEPITAEDSGGTVFHVYSARKFTDAPDGSYVIGPGAERYTEEYQQDYSSDTALFLLQRIEYGCEGKAYKSRMINERRIDTADIKNMSKLTRTMLDGVPYSEICKRRRANYDLACQLFHDINKIDVCRYYDGSCVPMVYPLAVEDDGLLDRLLAGRHFQGHWWSYLLDEMSENSFEAWISRYMVPITIDQRYGAEELYYIEGLVKKYENSNYCLRREIIEKFPRRAD